MVVHFKSSSRYDSTPEMQTEARRMRSAQAEVVSKWVDSLLTHGKEQDVLLSAIVMTSRNVPKILLLRHW